MCEGEEALLRALVGSVDVVSDLVDSSANAGVVAGEHCCAFVACGGKIDCRCADSAW
jgi:hypothetical protein